MSLRALLAESCARLLAARVTPQLLTEADGGEAWPTDLWAELGEAGFLQALGPDGVGWPDAYPLFFEAGRSGVPLPLAETAAAGWLLGRAGLDPSDGPTGLARSSLDLDAGLARGRLAGVAWGRRCGRVLALAAGAPSRLLVLRVEDLVVSPGRNLAGEPRDDLEVRGVAPEACVELPPELGTGAVDRLGALVRSAQMAGALDRALELSIAYAGDRRQFGRPIGAFQAVQQQLAVLAEHASLCAVAADAAFALAGAGLAEGPIAAAKVVAGEAAQEGCAIAHAVHGAIGVTSEHALRFVTRRLWSWRDEFGSERVWAERIGRAAAADGPGAWWPALAAAGAAPAGEDRGAGGRSR